MGSAPCDIYNVHAECVDPLLWLISSFLLFMAWTIYDQRDDLNPNYANSNACNHPHFLSIETRVILSQLPIFSEMFNLGFTEDISRICKSKKMTVLWSGRKKGSKYSLGNLRER
jgi:hypothetical protein